uniref:Uncharacterized protein n=1 Tax=Glycine max TaxID=3847 RepID=K7L5B2_SOYBN
MEIQVLFFRGWEEYLVGRRQASHSLTKASHSNKMGEPGDTRTQKSLSGGGDSLLRMPCPYACLRTK